jgi:hypothetical protein
VALAIQSQASRRPFAQDWNGHSKNRQSRSKCCALGYSGKGVGEIGIVGVAAAVANAVYHATGKRVRDLPITLDKLMRD